jgi:hypothetical protein
MNWPDTADEALRAIQQNTAGESNPEHFSVNACSGDVHPEGLWDAHGRLPGRKPRQRHGIVLFRYSQAKN